MRAPPATAPRTSARPSATTPMVPSPSSSPAPASSSARCGRTGRASSARTPPGNGIAAGHQLAGGGLGVLKLVLDAAKTDDPEKFRAAVLALDLPTGSGVNGWGVKFDEYGQNSNPRVQHYMLQWQNGQLVTVWPEEFTSLRGKWIPVRP